MLNRTIAALLLAVPAFAGFAQSLPGREGSPGRLAPDSLRVIPAAARLTPAAPLVVLAPSAAAVPEELDALQQWNAQHRFPQKIGFVRPLPQALEVKANPSWIGSIQVRDAKRLRVHLSAISIPQGAKLWAHGSGAPMLVPLAEGSKEAWTPPLYGSEITIYFDSPAAGSFNIDRVMEMVLPRSNRLRSDADNTSCLVDAACATANDFAPIAQVRRAIGQMQYVSDGGEYVCTGSMLNSKSSSPPPYFLTAHHCISTATEASSLLITWDLDSLACGGSQPDPATLPTTSGAQLIATDQNSDFTLLSLTGNIPPNRYYLGWNASAAALPAGTSLYRLSHPAPNGNVLPLQFSRAVVDTTTGTCSNDATSTWTRPQDIYSDPTIGGTYGGASGSPTMLADGSVVGQLHGLCGQDPNAGCDPGESVADGAFSVSYPEVQSFLAPGTSVNGPCVADANTACVLNSRFQVTVRYRAAFDDNPADTAALVKPVTGFASSTFETAFFYFNSPNNIEMLVKLLDQGNKDSAGRPTIAVLSGSATPLRVELTITDTTNGASKTYISPFNTQKGNTDFTAFVK